METKWRWGIDGITEAEPLYVLYKDEKIVLQLPMPRGKFHVNMDDKADILSEICLKLNDGRKI